MNCLCTGTELWHFMLSHEVHNLTDTVWKGRYSPVHQPLLLYQPLCFLSRHTTMKPRLSFVDGYTQKTKSMMKRTSTQQGWVFVFFVFFQKYSTEALDQDLVSSHMDLQEGLALEFKLGRLHLRASLLCVSGNKQKKVTISDIFEGALIITSLFPQRCNDHTNLQHLGFYSTQQYTILMINYSKLHPLTIMLLLS